MEATEQVLRLTPIKGTAEDAKVIQAHALTHRETLDAAELHSDTLGDTLRLGLFLSDGTGFEAIGSYTGVRSRAICGSCSAYGTSALLAITRGSANTAI